MTEHPMITLYTYGVYGWLAVLTFTVTVTRHQFKVFLDSEARRLEVKPSTVLAVLALLYSVGWPITVGLLLAHVVKGRGGRD